VISSSIAGIPELVETGVNGWLVVPGSVDSLVAAMDAALKCSAEQLTRLGQEGAERVARYHDARQEAHTLAQLFTTKGLGLDLELELKTPDLEVV
jgi:colanic acid/amylovoran biosynthesis glycosyltransferase